MKKIPKNGLKSWTEFYESGQVIAEKFHEDTRGMARSRIFSEERAAYLLRLEKWIQNEMSEQQLRMLFEDKK